MHAYLVRLGDDKKSFYEIIQVLTEKKLSYSWHDDLESLANALKNNNNERGIIVVSNRANLSSTIGKVEKLIIELPNDIYFFCVVDKITPADYKSLSRTGRAELTDWAAVADEVADYLQDLSKNLEENNDKNNLETAAHPSYVVSFVGTSGGAGNTTIAMEIGVELAQRRYAQGQKLNTGIAFLDLNFSNGAGVCDLLNVEPRLVLDEIAANPRRLDSYMLQMMASKHSSGLDIFCSKNVSYQLASPPNEALLLALLNCLVDNYSVLLIDIPNRSSFDIAEIVKNSDIVFCVGLLSVASTKNIKFMLNYLDIIGVKKTSTSIIATDVDVNMIGKLSPRFDLQKIFPDRKTYYIRRDRLFALESADAGISMIQAMPSKGISQDIKLIASAIDSFNVINGA